MLIVLGDVPLTCAAPFLISARNILQGPAQDDFVEFIQKRHAMNEGIQFQFIAPAALGPVFQPQRRQRHSLAVDQGPCLLAGILDSHG